MATSPTTSKAKTLPRDNFEVEKATIKGITLLTLHGALNDAFEGRKLAESIRSKKLVVNLRDVRRFASWGMSEWMDFLRITNDRDVYLVECSAYALSQINLITGLLGHGKLVSYYASFRCGSCSEELETLFLIPRDRELIPSLPGSSQECPTCGGQAWLEEYPAAFFDLLAGRPSFDIDDEVLAFFRSQYAYDLSPDLTRFRAYRRVDKTFTYLRLSGNIATLPAELMVRASEGTTVVDVEGIVYDPNSLSQWRAFVKTALPKLTSLQLVNCPAGFFEAAVLPEDLQNNKLKIRTFALSYDCARCYTTTPYMVDVAENLEELVLGIAPAMTCATCRSALVASVTLEQTTRLRSLPARDRNAALDKFLAAARAEPVDDLENCSISLPDKLPTVASKPGRLLYIALTVVLVMGLAVVGFGVWNQYHHDTARGIAPSPFVIVQPPTTTRPTFARPDWVMSDVPSSGYCNDMINRLMCVGVSSYRVNRDDAIAEANDVALDELVATVGLKISDPFFRDNVTPGYSKARAKALSALQAADLNRTSDAPKAAAAEQALRDARKRVVEALRLSGGAAVPTQRSDWHWEEYASEKGGANETLVFIRYDITLDALRALVERYSTTTLVTSGTKGMTAFPALAWQYPDFTGGVVLTQVGKSFASANISPQQIVTAVGDQHVSDASGFARQLEDAMKAPGDLKLTVKSGDTPEQVVTLKRH